MDRIDKAPASDTQDRESEMISLALAGNQAALNRLFSTHTNYVYNIFLRLYPDPSDAQDATQEVMIIAFNRLPEFKQQSRLGTWLYRIAVNYFLSGKRKFGRQRHLMVLPILESKNLQDILAPENDADLEDETRALCANAMLLCLNKFQRLVFVLGEVMGCTAIEGAELTGVSAANFRVLLFRARNDLKNYVMGKCGLVNATNPCRCPAKTKQLVAAGLVSNTNRLFTKDANKNIDFIRTQKLPQLSDEIWNKIRPLYRNQPFLVANQIELRLNELEALLKINSQTIL